MSFRLRFAPASVEYRAMTETAAPIRIAALYKFAAFADLPAIREPLLAACVDAAVNGTILVAEEGINGTIAGSPEAIEQILAHIRRLPGCEDIEVKLSEAATMPFMRMKVRLKKEIVTMGEPDIDPNREAGQYVDPADWNALLADPDTLLIDTRNAYEVATGTFDDAINPETNSFREFPEWFRANRERLLGEGAPRKVAMFCTGGIRCEKASALLKAEGVEEVYHLKGGILKYLEAVPAEESRWRGECFVFDERVTVRQGLEPGNYDLCRACRMPISAVDKASEHYVDGISCPACYASRNEAQRERYAERQRQSELAKARGEVHIGTAISRS